jgi:hypothetical protein
MGTILVLSIRLLCRRSHEFCKLYVLFPHALMLSQAVEFKDLELRVGYNSLGSAFSSSAESKHAVEL